MLSPEEDLKSADPGTEPPSTDGAGVEDALDASGAAGTSDIV